MKVLQILLFRTSLNFAMRTQDRIVKIVGQNFIAYHATGSITGIYEYGCELFKKRMECAIMMKVAEAEL